MGGQEKKSQGGMGRTMLELSESCWGGQRNPKVWKDHSAGEEESEESVGCT